MSAERVRGEIDKGARALDGSRRVADRIYNSAKDGKDELTAALAAVENAIGALGKAAGSMGVTLFEQGNKTKLLRDAHDIFDDAGLRDSSNEGARDLRKYLPEAIESSEAGETTATSIVAAIGGLVVSLTDTKVNLEQNFIPSVGQFMDHAENHTKNLVPFLVNAVQTWSDVV